MCSAQFPQELRQGCFHGFSEVLSQQRALGGPETQGPQKPALSSTAQRLLSVASKPASRPAQPGAGAHAAGAAQCVERLCFLPTASRVPSCPMKSRPLIRPSRQAWACVVGGRGPRGGAWDSWHGPLLSVPHSFPKTLPGCSHRVGRMVAWPREK